MTKNSITLHNTFACFSYESLKADCYSAFKKWALEAANSFTGFATSVIACGCEAGIESTLDPQDTPDGGQVLLLVSMSEKELAKQILNREVSV